MSEYTVVVGNIGNVYSGSSQKDAQHKAATYIEQSKTGRGRAGGESVTILKDNEILSEFVGSLDDWIDTDDDA